MRGLTISEVNQIHGAGFKLRVNPFHCVFTCIAGYWSGGSFGLGLALLSAVASQSISEIITVSKERELNERIIIK
jgi:hypothetical protein